MKLPQPFGKNETMLNVVVETPRGSSNKYVYNPKHDCFELKKILPAGTMFPIDFGFLPKTLGEDEQPLDVLVFMDYPAVPGCVVSCRCLGVIEAEQSEKDNKKYRNDRILAVAVESLNYEQMLTIKDVNANYLKEIIHFFEYYNEMAGKKFKFLGIRGQHAAHDLIKRHLVRK
jgi:inorganic pyrophosphatase